MMKPILALSAISLIAGVYSPATANHRNDPIVRVAIYRGPAACEDCPEAMARAIGRLSPRYQVDFVGPAEKSDVTSATLRRYRFYIQPGGGQDLDGAFDSLGASRVYAIRRFVARGGNYLGLCMGAYLADASNIGLVPAELDSEVARPGFAARTIDDAAVPVKWAGKATTVYYQDGPFLAPHPSDPGYRPIATYQNGDLAAARYSFGKGVVVLSGPHPEADRSWYEEADLSTKRMPGMRPLRALFDQFGA